MISNYLKEYFVSKGITQQEIALKTNIARSKINLSLNGKRKFSADELLIIAKLYDINLDKLKELITTNN